MYIDCYNANIFGIQCMKNLENNMIINNHLRISTEIENISKMDHIVMKKN